MLEFLIVFALGLIIGWKISDALTRTVWLEILKDLGVTDQQMRDLALKKGVVLESDTEDQEPQLTEVPVKIEQHGAMLYAFRSDNDQFLGQGTDRDQLIDSLRSRMTNVKLVVGEGSELLQKSHS